ncbi:PAS-domain containing protein, partial [Methylobacterium sp. E-016]|uniref:PAS-domain containing protein n=1 Tax=Methylobacterium sp. E-016 TaxID=2836556 RepID=UPI001FBB9D79
MSAERHYLDSVRREASRSLQSNGGILSPSWARYLDAIRHGLLMIDDAGRAIVSNAPAARLLADLLPKSASERSARGLLRALCAGTAKPRCAVFRSLREARDLRTAVSFEVEAEGLTLQVELNPAEEQGWIATIEDVSARKASEARADEAARQDPLTGLPNRLLLQERLSEALV